MLTSFFKSDLLDLEAQLIISNKSVNKLKYESKFEMNANSPALKLISGQLTYILYLQFNHLHLNQSVEQEEKDYSVSKLKTEKSLSFCRIFHSFLIYKLTSKVQCIKVVKGAGKPE